MGSLSKDILLEVNEIKSIITETGRVKLLDTLNTLCGLAESRVVIDEELDESRDAMTPLGGTIIEVHNVVIYAGNEKSNQVLES